MNSPAPDSCPTTPRPPAGISSCHPIPCQLRPGRSVRILRPLPFLFFGLVLGAHVLVALAPLSAATLLSTNLSTLPPPPALVLPEAGFSVLRVFGALMIVIGLFLAGVWAIRNWHRVSAQRGLQQLRILESRSLGGRHALHVVAYQDQRLLVASSPQGIALVSHLPNGEPALASDGAGPAAARRPDGMGPNFVRVLQQAIQQKP